MADKKISELPIVTDNIYKLSDSDVVAMVSASTTAQVTIKTLREKLTEFTAKTGSANTFTGNQIINGSVSITGKLTVNDIETIYQTSSVVFSSGSNKFGDNLADKHEFTGSTEIVGALTVNGDSVNISSLNDFTSSQLGVNTGTSIVTASFNAFSSSQLGVNTGISIVTSSINNFTSSQLGVNTGISIVTASFNAFSSSQLGVNTGISIVTASFNAFSSSQLGVNVGISIVTSSLNAESKSVSDRVSNIQAYTASVKEEISQLLSYTASINSFTSSEKIDVANIQAYTASVKYELGQIFVYTGSVKETISQTLAYTASVKNEVANIQAYTASVKETISQTLAYTASVKNEVANIQAYTASVKNEVANIQAYTASVKYELGQVFAYTGSVKNEIGQIVAYTSSLNSYTQSVKNEVANIQAYTASVKYELGQVFAYTSSVKNEIGQIVAYTASLNVFTSSAKLDIAGLQTYSHSLKSVALVSGSQQVVDYHLFALTASNNTFYGVQTISGSFNVTGSTNLTGSIVINQLTYPTPNFADAQYGVEVPTLGVNNVFTMQVPKTIYEYVKNDSGTFLPKGTPVHSTGTVGFNTLVIAASASVAATMPATFILAQDLSDEEEGLGIAIGAIQGVNTTGLQAGQPVWVGANGGWTQTKPTGSNLIQNLGIITKVGSNGGGVVLGAGRSNDVPNIAEGYLWVGNSGSVATPTPTSSFELSGRGVVSSSQQITNYYTFAQTSSANTFYGNQTINGRLGLEVSNPDTNTKLHIADTTNGFVGVRLSGSGDYTGTDWTIYASSLAAPSADDFLGFYNNSTTDSATSGYKVRMFKDGDVEVVDGNLVIGTSGKGIDFSATSNGSGTTTSELFDDYEYGTFTPIVSDAVTGGNTATGTFSATYTKIGRQVIIGIGLNDIDTTGMTAGNTIYIQGLPFACGASQVSPGVCNFYNVDIGSNNAIAWLNSAISSTALRVLKQSPTTNSGLIVSDITSGTGEITLSITYYT